ncbi:MAG: lysylphosphatidylglycerol synthase transmembrane domain-containing protein, partial [Bacteroidaceae bacterium]
MKKVVQTSIKIVLPIVLGAFALFWVYRDFDFFRAGSIFLHQMNPWWMLFSLSFGILAHVIRGLRWKQAIEPLHYRPSNYLCIDAIFLSYATNLVVPRAGEVARCGVLKRYDNIPFSASFGTVVTERIIDMICSFIFVLVSVFFQFNTLMTFLENTGVSIENSTSLFSGQKLILLISGVLSITFLCFLIFHYVGLGKKIKEKIFQMRDGLLSVAKVTNRPLYILYTIGIWACYFFHFGLTFYCFSFTSSLGIGAALLLFVAGSFAVLVPTPNGAGPWHFAIISGLIL